MNKYVALILLGIVSAPLSFAQTYGTADGECATSDNGPFVGSPNPPQADTRTFLTYVRQSNCVHTTVQGLPSKSVPRSK